MQREKLRESCAGNNRTPEQHMDKISAEHRNTTGDGCADSEAPISVLIETQHLAGEGHAERHQQQKNADDPGELARKFVGSEQEDLAQVDEHHSHHEVRAPTVYGPEKPSQGDAVVEELQAIPGLG